MRAEAAKEQNAYVTDEKKSQIKKMVMGILIGYAITCIVFLGYAMLITYTALSEKNLPIVVAVTTLLSVIVAGFDAARGAEHKGWLWGMGAGLIYAVVLAAALAVVSQGFSFDGRTATVAVLSVAGGGLGGVLGINIRT